MNHKGGRKILFRKRPIPYFMLVKLFKANDKGKDDSSHLVATFPYRFCYNGGLNEKILGLKRLVGIVR
jgi:hypothetical protein